MTATITRSLISLFFVSISAVASALPYTYEAVLQAELAATYSEQHVSAQLHVDGRSGQIELSLQPEMPACALGTVCVQAMPATINYTFTRSHSYADDCGVIHTEASLDQRPVDGVLLSVKILNNRNNICPTFVALSAMELIVEETYYDRMAGSEVSTVDTFAAEDFAMIKPAATY